MKIELSQETKNKIKQIVEYTKTTVASKCYTGYHKVKSFEYPIHSFIETRDREEAYLRLTYVCKSGGILNNTMRCIAKLIVTEDVSISYCWSEYSCILIVEEVVDEINAIYNDIFQKLSKEELEKGIKINWDGHLLYENEPIAENNKQEETTMWTQVIELLNEHQGQTIKLQTPNKPTTIEEATVYLQDAVKNIEKFVHQYGSKDFDSVSTKLIQTQNGFIVLVKPNEQWLAFSYIHNQAFCDDWSGWVNCLCGLSIFLGAVMEGK